METTTPIYPENFDLISIDEKVAHQRIIHLQKIEEQMKKDDVWSPVQTEEDTRFMCLPEWITLVMIPRDTKNLKNLLLPKNFAVGGMARYEQSCGVLPKLSLEFIKLLEEYDEMLDNINK